MVNASNALIARTVEEDIHESDAMADRAMVLKAIRNACAGVGGTRNESERRIMDEGFAPHSVVLKRSRLRKRAFDEAIQLLVETGDIEVSTVEVIGGKGMTEKVPVYREA